MAFFWKVGVDSSAAVLLSLIESCCVSILTSACESILWSKTMLKAIESAYSQANQKIFKTFDSKVILQCQWFTGQLPIELKIALRRVTLLRNLKKSDNMIVSTLENMMMK